MNLSNEAVNALFGRSLLLTQDWSTKDIKTLLQVATKFAQLDKAGKKADMLQAELAYAMFFDNSTRTKSAWSGAATRLGMTPVIVDGSSTQVSHGETASETGCMIGMNAHAIGVRHDLILGEGNSFMRDVYAGISDYLKATDDNRQVPIVNLQCDIDHPTQTLADFLWLNENHGDNYSLKGKKIAMTWAYSPSYAKPLSVPQGICSLFTRFGAEVVLAHPEPYGLIPEVMEQAKANAEASGGSFRITNNMDDAFEGAVAVYPKSWGPYDLMMERVAANKANDKAEMGAIERRCLDMNANYKDWICDERRMALTKGGEALYMHCLPADIGDEVTPGVMDKYKVAVAREANYKIYVIMAMLAVAKIDGLGQKLNAI